MIDLNTDMVEVTPELTGLLAKEIRKQLKTIGAVNIRQGYKGTGSQAAVRQLWCRFDNGAVIDLWIGRGTVVQLGGVVRNGGQGPRNNVPHKDTVGDTAKAVFDAVKLWKDGV